MLKVEIPSYLKAEGTRSIMNNEGHESFFQIKPGDTVDLEVGQKIKIGDAYLRYKGANKVTLSLDHQDRVAS